MPPQKSEPDEKLVQTTRYQKDLEAATGLVDTGHISSQPGASLERQTAEGRFKRKTDNRKALFISYDVRSTEFYIYSTYVWGLLISHPITCVSLLDTESAGIGQTFTCTSVVQIRQ